MSARPDPRLQQKASNFSKALRALEQSIALPISKPRDLSGIIKDFEITYELSWKSLKSLLEKQGHESGTAKNVFAKAYQLRLLGDEKTWLEMIEDRNLTVHTYDEKLAKELCDHIRARYVAAFQALEKTLKANS
jgi:nucleotidyltransferase substrate binding protein (TIGR01987 family)